MPDHRRVYCQRCDQPSSKVGPISWAGNCRTCGHRRLHENIDGMASMTNPARDRWREGMLGSIYPELLDRIRVRV